MADNINAPFAGSAGPLFRTVDTGSGHASVGALTPTSENALAITPTVSAALEASHVLKASAGNLYSLYVLNTSASLTLYLMVFNSTTVPADGPVTPIECIPVGPSSWVSVDNGSMPDAYAAGISCCLSTTSGFTKTVSGAVGFFKGRVQ